MEIAPELVADLARLSGALEDPDTDLETLLRQLGRDLKDAVGSYVGLTITIQTEGGLTKVTALEHGRAHQEILSSLLIPLALLAPAQQGSSVILYGARSGAFVDIAADLSWALGVSPSRFVLDKHCDGDLAAWTHSGLAELSAINQAIGALIERGSPPDEARATLRARAEDSGTEIHTVAAEIVAGLVRGSDAGSPPI